MHTDSLGQSEREVERERERATRSKMENIKDTQEEKVNRGTLRGKKT